MQTFRKFGLEGQSRDQTCEVTNNRIPLVAISGRNWRAPFLLEAPTLGPVSRVHECFRNCVSGVRRTARTSGISGRGQCHGYGRPGLVDCGCVFHPRNSAPVKRGGPTIQLRKPRSGQYGSIVFGNYGRGKSENEAYDKKIKPARGLRNALAQRTRTANGCPLSFRGLSVASMPLTAERHEER